VNELGKKEKRMGDREEMNGMEERENERKE
jgi:hypothetical protein